MFVNVCERVYPWFFRGEGVLPELVEGRREANNQPESYNYQHDCTDRFWPRPQCMISARWAMFADDWAMFRRLVGLGPMIGRWLVNHRSWVRVVGLDHGFVMGGENEL
ncbi:MAG: hypothetical protein ACPGWR_26615 [Ardenticatenaceae bacterium]